MLERFEGSDGLAAIFPAMLNSLIALKALGYPDDHPQVVRAERELKKLEHETADSVRIEPCFSPVWDTAIVAICLHESGIPADHPALKKCGGMADGQRDSAARRLAVQEPGQGRAERLGVRIQQPMESGRGRHGDGAAGAAQDSDRQSAEGATNVSSAA